MPKEEYFDQFDRSVEEEKEFQIWHDRNKAEHFHFKDALLTVMYERTFISASCLLHLLKNTFQMQVDLIPIFTHLNWTDHVNDYYRQKKKPLLHCFSYPLVSLAGLSYAVFRAFCLPSDLHSIGTQVPYAHNCSILEREVAEYYTEQYGQFYVEHAFSSSLPQSRFSGYVPDIYIPG